ncbi:MAG: hypothetical protein FJ386_08810 [Verrucomicrobia bacterium]|nr:hypothetical protein [Verrucomicrobiota bacterium]
MTTIDKARFYKPALLSFAAVWLLTVPATSAPVELKLQAQLVWGTNDKISAEAGYKEVDASLQARLRNVFKWQAYYEITRKPFSVASAKAQSVKLSEDCAIEVKQLAANRIEVKLIGKGRPIITRTLELRPATPLVIGGDDKNNTAWFVVLTQTEKV